MKKLSIKKIEKIEAGKMACGTVGILWVLSHMSSLPPLNAVVDGLAVYCWNN